MCCQHHPRLYDCFAASPSSLDSSRVHEKEGFAEWYFQSRALVSLSQINPSTSSFFLYFLSMSPQYLRNKHHPHHHRRQPKRRRHNPWNRLDRSLLHPRSQRRLNLRGPSDLGAPGFSCSKQEKTRLAGTQSQHVCPASAGRVTGKWWQSANVVDFRRGRIAVEGDCRGETLRIYCSGDIRRSGI